MTNISVLKVSCLDREGNVMYIPSGNLAFQGLVKSIREKGMLLPIYINKKKKMISGHFRFLAAIDAGLKEVPFRYAESEKEVDYGEE